MGAHSAYSANTDPFDALKNEVARAKRTSETLSVVIIRLARGNTRPRTRRRLGDQIAKSIRLSDTACWYDDRHVALMLPGSDALGAECVIDRIGGHDARRFHEDARIVHYPHPDDIVEAVRGYAQES